MGDPFQDSSERRSKQSYQNQKYEGINSAELRITITHNLIDE